MQTQNSNISSISYKVGFNADTNNEFQFHKPEEAPIFRPTPEEFEQGPLEYIKKIRPYAERYGICKIIPPKSFKPAFEVDKDKFAFKPRVQRINELEALTRAKLCFFEKIIKYWNLQGVSLKIPVIDRKIVDLYKLHWIVSEEGGFEQCVREKKWMKIATRLYPSNQNKSLTGSLLRQHYERILYPYDIFVSGATTGLDSVVTPTQQTSSSFFDSNNNRMDVDNKVNSVVKQENTESENASSNKRNLDEVEKECEDDCVKKGKTGRTVSRRSSARLSSAFSSPVNNSSSYTKMMNLNDAINDQRMNDVKFSPDKSIKIFCKLCNLTREQDRSRRLLECDTCKNNFHLNCLIVPLNSVPRGKWNCPQCVADLVPKLPKLYTQEFGFAESRCKYTLREFQEVADQFKRDYFNMELEDISCDLVEREFWRLVTCLDDICTVEYGADLHTNLVGSGFASHRNEKNKSPSYLNHPWNLNKSPLLEGSLFKYINSNINGMIIPWVYIGMCFATFCWHNEDHWTYSINYNHYGDVKTWYGVPGDKATEFEEAMSTTAPELFEASPDLLHQLVTICNPNILQQKNVPIYRINQFAGEFVVTFPRSYHAGFNQGFNAAEAVNFAPSDWLPVGRQCMTSYSQMKRYPVFSQDEMICNMSTAEHLDASLLNLVYDDLLGMVQTERNLRRAALDNGITRSQSVLFNMLPDDERQCDVCKTTCYLSALTCDCDSKKLVCLNHIKELCRRCPSHRYLLKYTFKLDELVTLLKNLEEKLDRYEKFSAKLKRTVNMLSLGDSVSIASSDVSEHEDHEKIDLNELIQLQEQAKELNMSSGSTTMTKLNENLNNAVFLQEKVISLLDQSDDQSRSTFGEFKTFVDTVSDLNVRLDREDELFEVYEEANKLIGKLRKLSNETKDRKALRKLIDSNESKFSFLNFDEFLDDSSLNGNSPVNRSPSSTTAKRGKRINRLGNAIMSPTIRNSAF